MTQTTQTPENMTYDVGIDDAFIVPIVEKGTATTPPVYGDTIYRLAIISKLSVKGNGKTTEKWASNKLFARPSKTTQHTLGLDQVGIPTAVLDEISGNKTSHGVHFGKTTPTELPEFAFGYIAPQSDGSQNAFWYPRVSLDPATELSYETQTEELAINDVSISMIANGLVNNDVLWSDFKSARKDASDLTIDSFMQQVVYDESQLSEIAKPVSNPVTGLTLTPETVEVVVGKTATVKIATTPAGAGDAAIALKNALAKSKDATTATAKNSNGTITVTGVKEGSTTADVTFNGISKSFSITVKAAE